ncbi:MAG TPA: SRPBCC family protein [Thermodesulfobacteriota bacterium]
MIKTIAIAVVALLAGVLGYAATRPDRFRIERTARIDARPEKVFALIEDFRGWRAWSPWETVDPAMARTYRGAERGKGAVYAWEGNRDVGKGRMEITDTTPPSRVVIRLEFIEPMEAQNTYLAKLMGLFVDMDRMLGAQFETGLANLKEVAEG